MRQSAPLTDRNGEHRAQLGLYLRAPGADPIADRFVLDRDGQRTILVPVPAASAAPDTAKLLLKEGVELIKLCAGFALTDAARVVEAVGDQVPVGHVTFAVDAVSGAAAYSAAF